MTRISMTQSPWFRFGAFSLGVCLAGSIGVHLMGGETGLPEFLAQWGFFTVLSGVVLLAAGRLAKHPNPNHFTTLMLGSVMLRMTMCLMFLFVYTRVVKPVDNGFLGWFFLLYVAFTVQEVRTLSRMVNGSRS